MTEEARIKDLLDEKRHNEIIGVLKEIRDLIKSVVPPLNTEEEKKEDEDTVL